MKKLLFTLFLITLFTLSCSNENESMDQENNQLRHVVLFTFNESSSQADISEVEKAFNALPSKIKEIKDFEWGINNSPEKINKGFTHCFFLTFDSEEGRDIYLDHPDHVAFGEIVTPHLADVLVVDYWIK
ncbi:MAG: Dabb family protein [bacterium]